MSRRELPNPSMQNPAENVGLDKVFYKGKLISKGSPEYDEFQRGRAERKAAERSKSVEVDPEVQAEYERRRGAERRVERSLRSEIGAVRTALSNFESAWSSVATYEDYAGKMTFAEQTANEQDWLKKRESVGESLRTARLDAGALDRVAAALASAKERPAGEGGFASELALDQLKRERESAFRAAEDQAETVRRLFELARQPGMEGVKDALTANQERLAEKQFEHETAKKAVYQLERLRNPRPPEKR